MAKPNKPTAQRVKINLPGGFVSVGDFRTLLEAAQAAGVQHVKIGARQQLLFAAEPAQMEEIEYQLFNQELPYEQNKDQHPNIVSSYVADGLFNQAHWLREGIYKDILASFTFTPRLKINIVDAKQSFVPYYTGHVNFVSSSIGNYWHLYIRWPKTNQVCNWSSLVYSMDIAAISQELENCMLHSSYTSSAQTATLLAELESTIKASGNFHLQQGAEALTEADFRLPYYEGFNPYADKYWLGIYRPDECYTVSFLLDVCKVCQTSRVGQLYTTPWRSIIIKDIHPEDRPAWDRILDRHRINLRHASNELNWQIEDWCEPALKLKRSIVQYFDRWNIRTYRLCFGIKIGPNTGIWGSIIIKQRSEEQPDAPLFDIFHTQDFKANSRQLVPYKQGITAKALPSTLKTLCDCFYDATLQNSQPAPETPSADSPEFSAGHPHQALYRCPHCLSIYDPTYGDTFADVPPGIAFDDLPASYSCGLCGAPKAAFIALDPHNPTPLTP